MRLRLAGVTRAVVVAPHPDDEVIGAAALIAALRRQGSHVAVIVVSDGAASHPDSAAWPRPRLIAARERESRYALRRLRVGRRDVTFLRLPDGALPAQQDRCHQRLDRGLRRLGRIDLLVGPAASDAHPDHRAVAAVLARFRFAGRRLAYRVWPPQRATGHRCRCISLPGGAAAKRSLIGTHRTQLGAIRDDPQGFTIARHELAVFAHPVERFVEGR
ncbi:PIG-L family deacetylase [Sphingomonas sp. CFBP8993]|uniref:PIG-L deacetylase family protein n=1 Tax=Sphingomonas sp. CFBP8993 TaxID=3096526 RepID=UPI002A6A95A8|nr:PIG-L family deacetylase [Sphingomonas sp. CFBP8993]MDY0959603.1 PIG-L family deacetylase [Sphingomonas sp. CFBP8993]